MIIIVYMPAPLCILDANNMRAKNAYWNMSFRIYFNNTVSWQNFQLGVYL